MSARVAITGLGAVSALGLDVASHLAGLKAGTVGIAPLRRVDATTLRSKIGAEVPEFDPQAYFEPRQLGLLDRSSQMGLIATREAVAQSSGALEGVALHRAGAIFSASIGYWTMEEGYQKLYLDKAPRPHPFTVPRAMPSGTASVVTMDLGIHGPAFGIASACSSASHAMGTAFHMVRSGMLDVAVAGGAEASMTPGMLRAWEALRVLSPEGCHPFSKDRSGLVLGEGAAVVVLENLEQARARGATILAEMTGFGMSSDGIDMTAPDTESCARAMSLALEDAGIAPEAVDYVNAHGTATPLNDKTESAAMRLVFGNRLAALPVSSTKSMYGHTLSASGALDMVATVLALREGFLPPTMGFNEADPECDVDCVPNASRAASPEVAISSSFAFGGLNAVLAVRRYPG
ncbi:beta-ketoacyl-[acyl-carrier-protein] synthase family protein [Ancylobacter mangrovi]|uniref:beta-ketoacyl-[acyl-carrier-protein] synthase family protein n=1 Tax=Ancylobacter mangrovi TaxID=2972472 RepID=UPI0021620043|nr:beta-ketoacyl-[acyl-carrier-protein] synthase family protein [Ancylobacter mangrovi]MCS0500907.1 beta-ketoacyl-[acyl-carrier-protein] synthase family protein [Ancylobacter mangrovi]